MPLEINVIFMYLHAPFSDSVVSGSLMQAFLTTQS